MKYYLNELSKELLQRASNKAKQHQKMLKYLGKAHIRMAVHKKEPGHDTRFQNIKAKAAGPHTNITQAAGIAHTGRGAQASKFHLGSKGVRTKRPPRGYPMGQITKAVLHGSNALKGDFDDPRSMGEAKEPSRLPKTDLRSAFDNAYNTVYAATKGDHATKSTAGHAAGNKAHQKVLDKMGTLKYKGMKESKSPKEHGDAVRRTSAEKFSDQAMETGTGDLLSHIFPERVTGDPGHHGDKALVAGQAAHDLRRARSIRHKPTGIKKVGKAAQRGVRKIKRVIGR